MPRHLIFALLLLTAFGAVAENFDNRIKVDYFTEMANDVKRAPAERLQWLDSLLSLPDGYNRTKVLLLKSQLLRQVGKPAEALKVSDSTLIDIDARPEDMRRLILYSNAQAQDAAGNLRAARDRYEQVMAMPRPEKPDIYFITAHTNVISVYYQLRDLASAHDRALHAIEVVSSCDFPQKDDYIIDILGMRAMLYLHENKLDSAYDQLAQARRLKPEGKALTGIYDLLAQLYFRKGEYGASAEYIDKALQTGGVTTNHGAALCLKADALMHDGKPAEALATLRLMPDYLLANNAAENLWQYYTLRGRANSALGNATAAAADMDSALIYAKNVIDESDRHDEGNALALLAAEKDLAQATADKSSLSRRVGALAWGLAATIVVALLLGALCVVLHRRCKGLKVASTKISAADADAEFNRRQAALLLKVTHMMSMLDAVRKRLSDKDFSPADREDLVKKIQGMESKEKIWDQLAAQFEQSNNRFLARLSELHPSLNKSEKRICLFILLNMSTKEIAEVLDRSPHTVDVTKYNLRKKLNINEPTETYLTRLARQE